MRPPPREEGRIIIGGGSSSSGTTQVIAKYSKLASTHNVMFYAIAIETAGTWDDMAIELVQQIGRRTTVITQDTRETVFLFQRLSIALQRGNAVSFLNTMNTYRIKSRCSRRCLTFCLVFTPAALCWWAQKIIMSAKCSSVPMVNLK